MVFLTKLGMITPAFLTRNRKYAVLVIFIVAAILTPPDVFTQILMAVPLLILYEVSIMLSKIVYRKKQKKEEDSDEL
jgi:sec-independent protein translocase protein TatC